MSVVGNQDVEKARVTRDNLNLKQMYSDNKFEG